MSGTGPASYLAGNFSHTAVPLGGTYVRETDGKPASLLDSTDYPVSARCKICDDPIRLARMAQWEWQHAPAPGGGAP